MTTQSQQNQQERDQQTDEEAAETALGYLSKSEALDLARLLNEEGIATSIKFNREFALQHRSATRVPRGFRGVKGITPALSGYLVVVANTTESSLEDALAGTRFEHLIEPPAPPPDFDDTPNSEEEDDDRRNRGYRRAAQSKWVGALLFLAGSIYVGMRMLRGFR